jgi:hypothetical protein
MGRVGLLCACKHHNDPFCTSLTPAVFGGFRILPPACFTGAKAVTNCELYLGNVRISLRLVPRRTAVTLWRLTPCWPAKSTIDRFVKCETLFISRGSLEFFLADLCLTSKTRYHVCRPSYNWNCRRSMPNKTRASNLHNMHCHNVACCDFVMSIL